MSFRKLAMILILALVSLTIVLAAAFAIFGFGNRPLEKAQVTVGGKTFQVEVASTTLARANGLSGRDGLGEDDGMYFVFDNPGNYGFWMKGMKFPIDIIWIADNEVAGFAENAAPQPGAALWNLKIYYPPEYVQNVLEVNAGTVKKYQIKVGDPVSFKGPL
jgi:uncharacterized membrane protein (UPF0127 family)